MSTTFAKQFESLTGFSPMHWQSRLLERFVANDLPDVRDIPTGLGKISVIVIWLLALARRAEENQVRLPRRLVYVVNRRTIVDQATETVERMRRRLTEAENPDWPESAARSCSSAARPPEGAAAGGSSRSARRAGHDKA